MGHYDDCYEATERQDRNNMSTSNKATLKTFNTHIKEVESAIDNLYVDVHDKIHLHQKLQELKALVNLYTLYIG